MEAGLAAQFDADHIDASQVGYERIGDLRYVGQGYELKIAIPGGMLGHEQMAGVWEAFHRAHAAEYGHAFHESPIEIVNVRVSGRGAMPKIAAMKAPQGGSLKEALIRTGPSVFRVKGELKSFDTPVYQRGKLPVGEAMHGPAIILQKDSTTVVPPGASASVHASGSILITLGETA
jgi:N-methylhydantoinase A